MRASAQWHRRLSERYAARSADRRVLCLKNYAGEFVQVGSGQPLVLVPGLAGGYELTGRLVRHLAQHFQVICFPLRGERESMSIRAPRSLVDLADDLSDFLDTLVLERPVVVGLSFGSAVALEFALRDPARVGALVLHGMESRFQDSLGGRIARLALEHFPLPHDNPFFNQFFRLLFARRESVGPLFDFVTQQCWRTDQSVMAQRLAMLADFDVQDRVESLRSPTLVLAGQEDVIVRPAAQRQLAKSLPDARFCSLPGAGHLCFLTRPGAFARQIIQFHCQLHGAEET